MATLVPRGVVITWLRHARLSYVRLSRGVSNISPLPIAATALLPTFPRTNEWTEAADLTIHQRNFNGMA